MSRYSYKFKIKIKVTLLLQRGKINTSDRSRRIKIKNCYRKSPFKFKEKTGILYIEMINISDNYKSLVIVKQELEYVREME